MGYFLTDSTTTAETYLSGSLVRTLCSFTNVSGALTDPTTIVLKYQPGPEADVVTVTYPTAPVIRDSTGAYHADLDTTGWRGEGALTWLIEWIGTGTVQAIGTDVWNVLPEPL